MRAPWLLIDVHNMAHRAFHSVGGLSFEDVPTGVLYGVFRDILSLRDRFKSDKFVFCFDYGESFRVNVHSGYKASRITRRDAMNDDERVMYDTLLQQIIHLRCDILHNIGFRNVLFESGSEADDIIAKIALALPKEQEAVIVSGDEDFYQLLRSNIRVYHPAKERLVDKVFFRSHYRIKPKQWIDVKCMAGCKTDDIPGVKGVGTITAIKYLLGQLNKQTQTYKKIKMAVELGFIEDNQILVELPYPATGKFKLNENHVTSKSWEEVMVQYGMRSLRKGFK